MTDSDILMVKQNGRFDNGWFDKMIEAEGEVGYP